MLRWFDSIQMVSPLLATLVAPVSEVVAQQRDDLSHQCVRHWDVLDDAAAVLVELIH